MKRILGLCCFLFVLLTAATAQADYLTELSDWRLGTGASLTSVNGTDAILLGNQSGSGGTLGQVFLTGDPAKLYLSFDIYTYAADVLAAFNISSILYLTDSGPLGLKYITETVSAGPGEYVAKGNGLYTFSIAMDIPENMYLGNGPIPLSVNTGITLWANEDPVYISGLSLSATPRDLSDPASPTPEPGTFLLMGAGLAGMVLYLRRRREQ